MKIKISKIKKIHKTPKEMYMYLWISLREQITDYMKSSIYSKVTDSSYLIPFINYDNITYFYLILYLFNENIIQPGATVFMLTFISKICKINWNQNIRLKSAFLTCEGPSWSWLHGSWFINTYNQWQVGGCLRLIRFSSPIKLNATI